MKYRRWFRGATFCIFCAVLFLSGAAWLIDPIELWEAPIIRGFNHIKPKQAVFLDVFKPFQVRRHAPEVVYIGTSRVYVGLKPEENAYNMGGSSLSLPDMRAYLRFIYSQHVPKQVVIGLDLFQFDRENMARKREGFSQERLDVLQTGDVAAWGEAWKTSLGMTNYLWETVRSSHKNSDRKKEWERGCDVKRGEKLEVETAAYYNYLHDFYETYANFIYDPDALLCLQGILKDAEARGVEIVLFFNPVSVDLLALQSICGREEVFRSIKKDVAALHPVYDFAWASSVAMDRQGVWLDGSHYHYPTGERMKATMTGKADDEICRVMTSETVNIHLQEEMVQYAKWVAGNQEYIRALAKSAPQKIPEKALAQYLGF